MLLAEQLLLSNAPPARGPSACPRGLIWRSSGFLVQKPLGRRPCRTKPYKGPSSVADREGCSDGNNSSCVVLATQLRNHRRAAVGGLCPHVCIGGNPASAHRARRSVYHSC